MVVCLATIIRLLHIGSTEIGQDEAFSTMVALFPIKDIISVLTQGDNPPLWEILLHYWMNIFGISTIAMRVLPFIFNILTIIPIYLIGAKKHWSVGLFAALFFTFGNFALFLSHEIRVYSLIGLLSAWSLYFFVGLLDESKHRIHYIIGLTVVNLLLMYGHYLAIWVVVMQVLSYLLVPRIRNAGGKAYLYHLLILVVLYIPMYSVLWHRFLDSGLHGTWIPKAESITDLQNLPYGFLNQNNRLWTFVRLMYGCYVLYIIINIKRATYRFGIFELLSCMWMIPLLISFILSLKVGFLLDRYFYFVIPPLYLSLAYGSLLLGEWLCRRFSLSGSLCSVVILGLMLKSFRADSDYLRYDHYHTKETSRILYNRAQDGKTKFILSPFWIAPKLVYDFDSQHELFRTRCELSGRNIGYNHFLTTLNIYSDNFKPFDFSSDTLIAVVHYKNYEPIHLQKNISEQHFDWCYTEDAKDAMQIDFYRKEAR